MVLGKLINQSSALLLAVFMSVFVRFPVLKIFQPRDTSPRDSEQAAVKEYASPGLSDCEVITAHFLNSRLELREINRFPSPFWRFVPLRTTTYSLTML